MSNKRIIVHRRSNTLEYLQNGQRVNKWDCVVGNDNATTLGNYKVLQKVADKKSNKYNNAPMPWSLKFSDDWKAIHGTGGALVRSWAQYFGVSGVGSHGCVGLPDSHAHTLYEWAEIGTPVEIKDD